MKYTKENCINEILSLIPGFKYVWEEHLDDWGGEPAGIILDMIEFATYTNSLLEKKEKSEAETIFNLVETIILKGSDEIINAVYTGFLESVINPVTKETEYLPLLKEILGEKSREYCDKWLNFTGSDIL